MELAIINGTYRDTSKPAESQRTTTQSGVSRKSGVGASRCPVFIGTGQHARETSPQSCLKCFSVLFHPVSIYSLLFIYILFLAGDGWYPAWRPIILFSLLAVPFVQSALKNNQVELVFNYVSF